VDGFHLYQGYGKGNLPHKNTLDFFFAVGVPSDKVKTILDVGAHNGGMTLGFHLCYPNSAVFAFEPNPASYEECISRLKAHPMSASALERKQIEVLNYGLFSVDRSAELFVTRYSDSSSLIPVSQRRRDIYGELVEVEHPVTVSLQTLDAFSTERRLESIDILKIDVEGSFKEVLVGGSQITLKMTNTVILEIDWVINPLTSRNWIDAVSLLHDNGLHLTAIATDIGNKWRGFSIGDMFDILSGKQPSPMSTWTADCVFRRLD